MDVFSLAYSVQVFYFVDLLSSVLSIIKSEVFMFPTIVEICFIPSVLFTSYILVLCS